MAGKIDKTRPEFTGLRSFIGSGVGTVRDLLEEQQDPRQMIQDMISEALSNVVGATTIQDVPDQITYNFAGGGITQSQLDNAINNLFIDMWDIYDELLNKIQANYWYTRSLITNLQQQINNLESGTGSGINIRCRAYLSSAQVNIPDGINTDVEFDTASIDPLSMFDSVAHTITMPVKGTYLVFAAVDWLCTVTGPDGAVYRMGMKLNGVHEANLAWNQVVPAVAERNYPMKVTFLYDFDKGDYITVDVLHNVGAQTPDLFAGLANTHFGVFLVKNL